jgi:hypothetical protein
MKNSNDVFFQLLVVIRVGNRYQGRGPLPSESAHTWPVISTSKALLIAVTSGLVRITDVSLMPEISRISIIGLSSIKSYSVREPM